MTGSAAMKIGELAARAGCDVQTVRYYEREGLLEAPARSAAGYRHYDAWHLTQLQFIRHCRALDIPLGEVRQLLALAAQPQQATHVDDLLDRHLALVTQRLAALTALHQQLTALRGSCDGDTSHPCTILQSFMSAVQDHACACHPVSPAPAPAQTARA